jgi:hypothetical protein
LKDALRNVFPKEKKDAAAKKKHALPKENDDEYYNKIYDLYRSKAGDFQNIFVVLLIASMLFMFIILVPYVSTLQRGFDNNKELISLNKNATQIQSNMGNITAANTSMLVLVTSLDNTEKELSSLVSNISLFQLSSSISSFNNKVDDTIKSNNSMVLQKAYPKVCGYAQKIADTINPLSRTNIDKLCTNSVHGSSSSNSYNVQNLKILTQQINGEVATLSNVSFQNKTILSMYPQCNTNNKTGSDDWANCILNKNFEEQIKKYNDTFSTSIIPPLNNLDHESQKLIHIDDFQKNFNNLTNQYTLRSNSFFAKNNTLTPSQMSNEFRREITSPLQNEIIKLSSAQHKKLSMVNDDIRKHKDEVISVERQKDNISARLNSTQFVFGTLPLTLTQSISGLPVGLAIGFLICVVLLKGAINYQSKLKSWYKDIAGIAPLWIYPKGRLNMILRFLIFSTPFIVFIIACCLIAYSFTLCPHNKDLLNTFGISSECLNHYMDLFRLADFRIWIYVGLYVASFIIFIIGFRVIVIERPVTSSSAGVESSRRLRH